MRILTWNCQGAFRKKYPLVADLAPDLAVIQECEQLERIPWKWGRPPTASLWFGESPTKGLGVFSWSNLAFEALAEYDHSIRYVVPLKITAPYSFNLLAVWAMEHARSAHSYSAQIFQAVGVYREFIQAGDTVFMGDYNSSQRTTPHSRMGNHATLALALHDLWLVSAYHQYFFEKQGEEKQATYFRSRKLERPAHLDYAYIPSRWTRRLKSVQVGAPATWLQHSDHCPVIVEIAAKGKDVIV
jgi:exodeoxyribonuclease III